MEGHGRETKTMAIDKAENVIEIENLVAHYGDRVILQDINLAIRTGEIMVIMGGSGSGKTTLMRNMLGSEQAHIREHSNFRKGYYPDQTTRALRYQTPDRCGLPGRRAAGIDDRGGEY